MKQQPSTRPIPTPRLSRRQRLILGLLAGGGEMAGLDLVAASRRLGRGTVYVALRRLADKGLVASRPVDGGAGDLPRRLFRLTRAAQPSLGGFSRASEGAFGLRRLLPAALREAPAW